MQKKVEISGAVSYPGKYTILNANDKISDIIERAGGLKPNAYPFGSSFFRGDKAVQINLEKILKKKKSSNNLVVRDGDKIFIASKENLYQVLGEVSSPGYFSFEKKLRVSDALKNAGGFSQQAQKNDIYITHLNGKSKKYIKYFQNPRVKDGSIIHVGEKADQEPFDRTEYAKELTSILANIAQAVSLLILAKSN